MSKITDLGAALDPQFERVSDTPRTDVAQHNMGSVAEPHYVVDVEVARDLERELAEAKKELNDKSKFCYAVEQALDGLKGDYVKIIAALRKDAATYRWLRETLQSAKGGAYVTVNEHLSYYEKPEIGKKVKIQWYPITPIGFYIVEESTLDAAIDAAMKECGK